MRLWGRFVVVVAVLGIGIEAWHVFRGLTSPAPAPADFRPDLVGRASREGWGPVWPAADGGLADARPE